ncbi:MAG: exosortase/archaeosortase family protein [Candidatus Bathyarchaeota archaeon]|nr:exosortase/archaeosortase family protein [Candidatus Bathyarchaeum sp.]
MTSVFRDVIRNLKRNPHVTLSAVVILLTVLIVYWNDLSLLVNEALYNEAVTYVLIVPVLAAYIAYRKRDSLKASLEFENLRQGSSPPFLSEVVGLCFCLLSFLIYWYGSSTFYPLEYHLVSLPIFLTGVVLILFNFKASIVIAFPILFLLFFIPIPSEVTYTIGALIGNFNTQASYTLLKTLGLPVILDSTYGSPTIAVNTASETPMLFSVDLACSGIYSLITFVMFATFLAYIIDGSLVKKACFFLFGFVLLQALNIIRISTIIAIGYWFGEALAMTLFHGLAGWILVFCGILGLLLISEKFLHLQLFRRPNKLQTCSSCSTSLQKQESFCYYCGNFLQNVNFHTKLPKKFWIKASVLMTSLFLVALSIQSPVFAFAQGLTFNDPNMENTAEIFPEFDGHLFRFLYRDVDYEEVSGQDASLMYAYVPLNASTQTVYVDIGVADSITTLHNWEVCYVTWQTAHGRSPSVSVIDSRDIQLLENPPIIGRYFVFESPDNYTQLTLYWYEEALFNTGFTVEQKFVRISLIIMAPDSTSYSALEDELLTFAQAISTYWEPLKSQSLFSLSIPILQVLLFISITFIIVTVIIHYKQKWRKKMDSLKLFENLGSTHEKLLYHTLQNLNEGTGATTEELAHAIEQATSESLQTEELMNMLTHLQENGLVEKAIKKITDKPQLVWRP